MNDQPTTPQGPSPADDLESVLSGNDQAPIETMPVEAPRRAASLTLRNDDARADRAVSMEAANESLADALRIAYRCLQGVMVLIIIAFALSGYQQVNESEQGLRLRFGAVQEGVVEPGPQLSWPKGFGEIVRTSRTQQQYQLSGDFMPARYNPARDVDAQGTGAASLVPGADGSLITADGRLVHAQLAVTYRRTDIRAYNENIYSADEEELVKAMVRRAMVHACANAPINDLLTRGTLGASNQDATDANTNTDGDTEGSAASGPTQARSNSSLEGRLRTIVNSQIADANYGITMDSVSVGLITPPLRLRSSFQRVIQVESEARTARENAREQADALVNSTAGTATAPLLMLMDEYERRVDLNDETGAEEVLGEIFAVLDGDRDGANVEIMGRTFETLTLGGAAAEVVGEALRERRTMGDIARREAETFNAKLEQYRANPRAFLVREWTEAMNSFLLADSVQVFMVPPTTDVFDLLLNNDPSYVRERQRAEIQKRLETNLGVRSALRDNPSAAGRQQGN